MLWAKEWMVLEEMIFTNVKILKIEFRKPQSMKLIKCIERIWHVILMDVTGVNKDKWTGKIILSIANIMSS